MCVSDLICVFYLSMCLVFSLNKYMHVLQCTPFCVLFCECVCADVLVSVCVCVCVFVLRFFFWMSAAISG